MIKSMRNNTCHSSICYDLLRGGGGGGGGGGGVGVEVVANVLQPM